MEVARIEIKKSTRFICSLAAAGGFILHDIPAEVVNDEYLKMLLEECSVIEYLSVVNENPQDLSTYSLDNPMAIVNIQYTDKTTLTLEIVMKSRCPEVNILK